MQGCFPRGGSAILGSGFTHPIYLGILILYFKIDFRFLWTCDFINSSFQSPFTNVCVCVCLSLTFGIWFRVELERGLGWGKYLLCFLPRGLLAIQMRSWVCCPSQGKPTDWDLFSVSGSVPRISQSCWEVYLPHCGMAYCRLPFTEVTDMIITRLACSLWWGQNLCGTELRENRLKL